MSGHRTSLAHRAWQLLRTAPATPHDIAESLGIHVSNARAVLFYLKETGRAARLDLHVPNGTRTGLNREYLWGAE